MVTPSNIAVEASGVNELNWSDWLAGAPLTARVVRESGCGVVFRCQDDTVETLNGGCRRQPRMGDKLRIDEWPRHFAGVGRITSTPANGTHYVAGEAIVTRLDLPAYLFSGNPSPAR